MKKFLVLLTLGVMAGQCNKFSVKALKRFHWDAELRTVG